MGAAPPQMGHAYRISGRRIALYIIKVLWERKEDVRLINGKSSANRWFAIWSLFLI